MWRAEGEESLEDEDIHNRVKAGKGTIRSVLPCFTKVSTNSSGAVTRTEEEKGEPKKMEKGEDWL